ncbi:MAG: response regulator [Candidatus Acidiferrum sp.]|jgi:PAS domain S-box-containing protein
MTLFKNSSIQRKLTFVIVCTSLVGLSIACLIFDLYERTSFRSAMTGELSVLADTLGANTAATLAFNDRKSAENMLGGLRAERHIVAAGLYDSRGAVFAEYLRDGIGTQFAMPTRQEDGAHFDKDSLTLFRTVTLDGEKTGAIVIVSDLTALQAKIRKYTEISAIVILISILATYLVASRLLRLITEPILHLSQIAARVTTNEDYAVRAIPRGEDEVGALIGSFNRMLERIQERDAALLGAKDELELRVQARTRELQLEVNERMRAEETLSEERKVLRALIDNVPDFMYVKDLDCRFVVANLSVARQMGAKTPEELLGKNDFDFYPREVAAKFHEDEQRVIRSGKAEVNREEPGVDTRGNVSQVMTTQVPLRDKNGKVTGLVGIGRDITHLKKVQEEMQTAREAAEAASRAKSEFLANMSHEIRTPLNGVMGMTDLALETQLTPEQREYLETVKMSGDSLLTVINDILDFSKIEAGKIDLEAADFNLRESLESTLKTLALRADEKGLELLCEVAPDVPEIVRGDSARLRQIVVNLVGNAIKFTDKGEIAVKVQVEAKEDLGCICRFTVADSGIGIPEDKRELIFKPFSQADTSTTRKYGGTGLGLTISSRLVGMMGGKIWVESEVGVGSQFHFTVRLGAADVKEIKLGTVAPPELLRGVKVLVVDDNRTNRRILEGMLLRWQMKPTQADGGRAALAQLSAAREAGEPYGLILTDMHMPDMDGFALVEAIRCQPELSTATIMMLTSAGHRGDAARCQELGVAAYLLKPIRQSELREAVARVLGAREHDGAIPLITRFSLQDAREPDTFLRVLLAEDNLVNQRLAVRLLEKRGHQVVVAATGLEALKALEKEKFDLVLMDVQMPEMDGLEATAVIREKEKRTGMRQAVVALTAHAMKGDREKCMDAGMDGYLTKPIRPQELDQLLEVYVLRRMEARGVTEPAMPRA